MAASTVDRLPARLHEARVASGVKRMAVAVAIGRTTESLHAYESGRATPPLAVLERLATVYGVSLTDLLAEDGEA